MSKKIKRLAAIAFSDLHANDWNEAYPHNRDRLFDSLAPLVIIGELASKENVPILFAGDLIHKPKGLGNRIFQFFTHRFTSYVKKPFICIDGNHDQSEKNTRKHKSPNYVETLSTLIPNMHYVGNGKGVSIAAPEPINVYGIPYLKHNIGFRKEVKRLAKIPKPFGLKILLIHTDLPGAKNEHGYEINSAEDIDQDLDKYFKGFDLVLCGHIHKPQKMAKNVFILGAPYQQNKGEMGIDMGYWKVFHDGSVEFVKLNLPEYKYYDGERPKDNNHIYIPRPKKFVVEGERQNSFNSKQSRSSLAKSYLKEKKIKDKSKRKALIKTLKKV